MEDDGSSVRIKVAQYCVDKKLQETKQLQINTHKAGLTCLHGLPQYFGPAHPETNAALADVDELPPLFPSRPDNDASWDELKKLASLSFLSHTTPKAPTSRPYRYRVAIIGAGLAGLRTAKLLQD